MTRKTKARMRPTDNFAPYGETHWFVANLNKADFEAYGKGLDIINGRGVARIGDKVKFEVDEEGRFDSLTSDCSSLAEFEAMFDMNLTAITNHAFVFVEKASVPTSVNSAYVLGIKDRRLIEIVIRADEDVVYEPMTKVVDPRHLRRYLETHGNAITDDTVLERMWWVDQAIKHHLLSDDYERYLVGMDGKDRWRAFDDVREAVMSGGWLQLY